MFQWSVDAISVTEIAPDLLDLASLLMRVRNLSVQ